MIFFMPIESPERVTKVGILTRKLVWMVWTPLPPDGVQLELEVQWPASDSDATASESDASCPVTAASRGGVGSAALVSWWVGNQGAEMEAGKELMDCQEYAQAVEYFDQILQHLQTEITSCRTKLEKDPDASTKNRHQLDVYLQMELLASLGYCYLKLHKPSESMVYYEKCLQAAKNAQSFEWQAIACGGIG